MADQTNDQNNNQSEDQTNEQSDDQGREYISEIEESLKTEIEGVKKQMEELKNQFTSNKSSKKSKPSGSSSEDNLSLKKLQTELESLKNELQEKETKNLENERNNQIKDIFFREGIQYVDSAMNLFLAENKDKLKMENSDWFVEEGDKVFDLKDYVNRFMERPEIKSFKAKQTKGGNIKPPEKDYPSGSNTGKKPSLNSSLFVED